VTHQRERIRREEKGRKQSGEGIKKGGRLMLFFIFLRTIAAIRREDEMLESHR